MKWDFDDHLLRKSPIFIRIHFNFSHTERVHVNVSPAFPSYFTSNFKWHQGVSFADRKSLFYYGMVSLFWDEARFFSRFYLLSSTSDQGQQFEVTSPEQTGSKRRVSMTTISESAPLTAGELVMYAPLTQVRGE